MSLILECIPSFQLSRAVWKTDMCLTQHHNAPLHLTSIVKIKSLQAFALFYQVNYGPMPTTD
jgi:hypothetical protein